MNRAQDYAAEYSSARILIAFLNPSLEDITMVLAVRAEVLSNEIEALRSYLRESHEPGAEEIKLVVKDPTPIVPGAAKANSWHDIPIEFVVLGTSGVSALAVILKNYWLSKRKKIRLIDAKTGKTVEYEGTDSDLARKLLQFADVHED